jgi:hypothetical protein
MFVSYVASVPDGRVGVAANEAQVGFAHQTLDNTKRRLKKVTRVARWFVFKPKIKIWGNFGGLAMEDVGIFYGHLVHFTAFCYILWSFGNVRGNLVYFPVLVFCTKKNLAILKVTKIGNR